MFKNYLKIAWRRITRNKLTSFISIGGLAIGIAFCLLLFLSVRFQFTYDNFQKNGDRIFRVTQRTKTPKSRIFNIAMTPYPLADAMDSTFAGIEYTVQLWKGTVPVLMGGKFQKEKVLYAGSNFFKVFSFPLIVGNKATALSKPLSVVLTKSAARKFFGDKPAIGKELHIRINKKVRDFRVSAIAKDVPTNSSIQFNIIIPYKDQLLWASELNKQMYKQWGPAVSETWVMLNKRASSENIEEGFPPFVKTHFSFSISKGFHTTLGLQPMANVYLNQKYSSLITKHANIKYIIILGIIAFIILAISAINFMSLTLSRIRERNHAIGIRKASGANYRQLGIQIMGEVFLTCCIAFAIGLALAEILTPWFRQITQQPLNLGILADPVTWGFLVGILLFITLITGIYPVIVSIRTDPSHLFGSRWSSGSIPVLVKGLIITQFALSIAFLIGTVTINRQIDFMINKNLGYNPHHVIAIGYSQRTNRSAEKAHVFIQEAKDLAGVKSIAEANFNYRFVPDAGLSNSGIPTSLKAFNDAIPSQSVSGQYLKTMGIKLIKGHTFSDYQTVDLQNDILVNQLFVQTLGLQHPVGHIIHDVRPSSNKSLILDGKKIIGVIRNYNFEPLSEKLRPLILFHYSSKYAPKTILVKTQNKEIGSTISSLRKLWSKIFPYATFNYALLNDLLAQQYHTAFHWSFIMKLASAIVLFLACFGLFGLAMLAVQRRTKEVGIRKVMGATVTDIVNLLSKDFIKLVLIGFFIAIPVAWYFMHRWLQNFAYRINMSPWIFILAGALALIIALATVSWQSIRAALANPVDSLRSE